MKRIIGIIFFSVLAMSVLAQPDSAVNNVTPRLELVNLWNWNRRMNISHEAAINLNTGHISNTNNPHSVSLAQVGIGSWTGSTSLTTLGTIVTGIWYGTPITDAYISNLITLSSLTQIQNRSHTSLSDIGSNSHAAIDAHISAGTNPHLVTAEQVGLGSVENTALSTWEGTTNITTLGPITAGSWLGTAISDAYISSAATWNTAYSHSQVTTGNPHGIGYGDISDFEAGVLAHETENPVPLWTVSGTDISPSPSNYKVLLQRGSSGKISWGDGGVSIGENIEDNLTFATDNTIRLIILNSGVQFHSNLLPSGSWLDVGNDSLFWRSAYLKRLYLDSIGVYADVAGTGSSMEWAFISPKHGTKTMTEILAGSAFTYPSAGIPLSTGSEWGTSITDNSSDWNEAYSHSQTSTGNPHGINYGDISDFEAGVLAYETTYSTFTSSAAGLAPLSGGGTTNFLRADGAWAEPPGVSAGVTSVASGNGMDFTTITETGSATLGTPSTLSLSTTNSVTTTSHTHALSIPNFTSSAAGLAPLSGGGTTNFLRADGAWVAPPGGGGSDLGDTIRTLWDAAITNALPIDTVVRLKADTTAVIKIFAGFSEIVDTTISTTVGYYQDFISVPDSFVATEIIVYADSAGLGATPNFTINGAFTTSLASAGTNFFSSAQTVAGSEPVTTGERFTTFANKVVPPEDYIIRFKLSAITAKFTSIIIIVKGYYLNAD